MPSESSAALTALFSSSREFTTPTRVAVLPLSSTVTLLDPDADCTLDLSVLKFSGYVIAQALASHTENRNTAIVLMSFITVVHVSNQVKMHCCFK